MSTGTIPVASDGWSTLKAAAAGKITPPAVANFGPRNLIDSINQYNRHNAESVKTHAMRKVVNDVRRTVSPVCRCWVVRNMPAPYRGSGG